MKSRKSFNEIIQSEKPILIDFTATWCGPCKMMAPILKEVSAKIGDKGRIIKIDIDANKEIAQKLQIMGVPTFILYKEGKVLWRESGVQTAHQLEHLILDAAKS